MSEPRKEPIDEVQEERDRCEAWIQHFRSQGETDHRSMIYAIRGGEWPEEDEDEV